MTTRALLLTCINHPLSRLYFAYDNYLNAIDLFAENCNVFQAFINRPDAAEVMIELYADSKVLGKIDEGFLMKECFLELVMGTGYVNNIISRENSSHLGEIVEKRLKEKLTQRDTYSYVSYKSTLFLKEICDLQDTLLMREKARSVFDSLNSKYNSAVCTKMDYVGNITVYTRYGVAVEGTTYTEITPSEYSDALLYVYETFRDVEVVDEPTSTYNCHSYAWNICDGGATCWIEPYTSSGGNNVSRYWTNDYYGETSQSSADKAVYFSGSLPNHSAVWYSDGVWESKWGYGPLVRHSLFDTPYEFTNIKYYAKTVHTILWDVPSVVAVNSPVVCDMDWLSTVGGASFVWLITDQHDNETGFTQNCSGANNTITFTQAGAYEIDCSVYLNSECIAGAHAQIIVTN